MKRISVAVLLFTFVGSCLSMTAQEKAKTEEKSEGKRDPAPVRVQVVISEYDGEKKISSLPYTIITDSENRGGPMSKIRMGLKVPIATSTTQFQYQDLGTNLDAWVGKTDDGRFILHLRVERSSTYSSSAATSQQNVAKELNQPVIQQFTTELNNLVIRDGQTIQSTAATDPASGRVSKVDVTLNVLK